MLDWGMVRGEGRGEKRDAPELDSNEVYKLTWAIVLCKELPSLCRSQRGMILHAVLYKVVGGLERGWRSAVG